MPIKFAGFPPPTTNFTIIPDALFDELLGDLSGNEFKVLCYIARHTWGYKKDADHISLAQFQKGIVKRSGARVDTGVGLSKQTIVNALSSLWDKSIIEVFKDTHANGGAKVNLYRLKMRSNAQS